MSVLKHFAGDLARAAKLRSAGRRRDAEALLAALGAELFAQRTRLGQCERALAEARRDLFDHIPEAPR